MSAGSRQLDHTADLALEVWADSEPALLAEAARAVVAVLTGGATLTPDARRPVTLTCVDAEDRLVQWVNEVLYAAVVEGFLATGADIELDGADLRATLSGQARAAERIVTELKSATYHDLHLTCDDGGCRARIIIDV